MSASVGYGKEAPPKANYVADDTTVMFDSYVGVWLGTQAIGLTTKSGVTQDLITWEQLTSEARDALSEADFESKWSFSKVVMLLKGEVFTSKLKKAYPFFAKFTAISPASDNNTYATSTKAGITTASEGNREKFKSSRLRVLNAQ